MSQSRDKTQQKQRILKMRICLNGNVSHRLFLLSLFLTFDCMLNTIQLQ